MKVNKLHVTAIIFLLCTICGGVLYSFFSPPKHTPCMPINFPEGKKIEAEQGRIYTFVSDQSYDVVHNFYKDALKRNPQFDHDGELATWHEYSIRDFGVLFRCGSRLNGYELELGCIFINRATDSTVIYALWSYNEGPGIPCDYLPEVEAEDYLETLNSVP